MPTVAPPLAVMASPTRSKALLPPQGGDVPNAQRKGAREGLRSAQHRRERALRRIEGQRYEAHGGRWKSGGEQQQEQEESSEQSRHGVLPSGRAPNGTRAFFGRWAASTVHTVSGGSSPDVAEQSSSLKTPAARASRAQSPHTRAPEAGGSGRSGGPHRPGRSARIRFLGRCAGSGQSRSASRDRPPAPAAEGTGSWSRV